MNQPHAKPNHEVEHLEELTSPRMLQRLADGELTPETYRRVLAALEQHPEGWRRCALAFLESQALQRDLCLLFSDPVETQDEPAGHAAEGIAPPVSRVPADRRFSATTSRNFLMGWQGWRGVGYWSSLAACLLLGLLAGGWISRRPGVQGGPTIPEKAASSAFAISAPAAVPLSPVQDAPIGAVRLVTEAEPPQEHRIPVYELPALGGPVTLDRWLESSPLAWELERSLRDRGFEVQREQHWLSAPLEDGRQAIVPVEGYYIQPARWTY